MSTPSLTIVYDTEDIAKEICVIYIHWAGGLEHHGYDLVDYLCNKKIVNGISCHAEERKEAFNGMNCLCAFLIKEFKQCIGSLYIYPAGTRDLGEEYIYHVRGKYGDECATVTVDVLTEDGNTTIELLNPKTGINKDEFEGVIL